MLRWFNIVTLCNKLAWTICAYRSTEAVAQADVESVGTSRPQVRYSFSEICMSMGFSRGAIAVTRA